MDKDKAVTPKNNIDIVQDHTFMVDQENAGKTPENEYSDPLGTLEDKVATGGEVSWKEPKE